MNERIKELMIQTDNHFGWCLASEDLVWCEKFAEFIVRECAKVCRNQSNEYAMELDRENCASAIEEYFGVEE